MLPIVKKFCINAYLFIWLLVMCCLPATASAADQDIPGVPGSDNITSVSAQSMLVNLAKAIPNLMEMTTAIAYVLGMWFIIAGIIRMKHLGESRTMMSQEHSIKGPLILLAVGAMLLYLPTSVQVGMSTFWTDPNPYGYLQGDSNQWQQFINLCFLIVQFVGTIAFIRGLVILSHMGGHGAQQGTFGKGLTHIIGGICCINIYQFVQMVFATFGMSISY